MTTQDKDVAVDLFKISTFGRLTNDTAILNQGMEGGFVDP